MQNDAVSGIPLMYKTPVENVRACRHFRMIADDPDMLQAMYPESVHRNNTGIAGHVFRVGPAMSQGMCSRFRF